MDDLAAFIEARLDEDEAAPDVHAEGCALHAWLRNDVPSACDCGYPARVLREVRALRWLATFVDVGGSVKAQREIAAVWSAHPDYRAEWAPGHG
jgi:hypothetical protein